jgi:MFS transporter, DHA1 family, tetracycline resistance protein
MNAIMSRQVAANAQGELQGGVASLYSVSAIVGPPLMTQIFGAFSADTSHVYLPGAAFLCASTLATGGALLFLRAVRSARSSSEPTAVPPAATAEKA